MVTKTRDKLIEVARQLFAHKGVENTTMNDIATASDKGRRTIYTYFKNKREIYNAVIERESNQLVQSLRDVLASADSPATKLRRFMERRFDMYSPEPRHDMLRTILSRDIRRIERIRRMASAKEREIFGSILAEGVKAGDFDAEQARRIPALEVLFVGSDYLSIRSGTDDDRTSLMRRRHDIIDFIIQGLASRPVGQADAVP